jgi:hypothetical protein
MSAARHPLSLLALTSLNILRQVGFAKRPALERLISEKLGRRIIRVSGVGGGIRLF